MSKSDLKWEWDEGGEWTAYSRAMDPDMVDQPKSEWCREWCLTWRITVDKEGRFGCEKSDDFLRTEDFRICRKRYDTLVELQVDIEQNEDEIRSSEGTNWLKKISGNMVPIVLLPAEKYLEGK